jgi:hypothetical protein
MGLLAAIDMRQSSARLFHNGTVNDSNCNVEITLESSEKHKRSLSPIWNNALARCPMLLSAVQKEKHRLAENRAAQQGARSRGTDSRSPQW